MKKYKIQIIGLILFLIIIEITSNINNNKKNKNKLEEVKNSIKGKIMDFKYLSRGVYLFKTSDGKIFYSMAFNYIRDEIQIGDSIFKKENSKSYFYFKYDSIQKKYNYYRNCEIYLK